MIDMVLLQTVGMPAATWVSIGLMIIIGLAGFLIRDAYTTLKDHIKNIEKIQADHAMNDIKVHAEFETKLNDTNIKILQEISAISLKLAEFKRDSTHEK